MRDLSVPLMLHVTRTDSASKKKRVQRAHGGKQGDKGLRHFSMNWLTLEHPHTGRSSLEAA
jgi:hypothetical protein